MVIKLMELKKSELILPEHNAEYTIPPKENNSNPCFFDFWIYKGRHLVECFFNKIKAFRRVATRHDKLASSFLAFIYIEQFKNTCFFNGTSCFQCITNPHRGQVGFADSCNVK